MIPGPEWVGFVHEVLFVMTVVAVLIGALFYAVTQTSARIGAGVERFVARLTATDDRSAPAEGPDVTIEPEEALAD